jgi:hypothetical protein
LNLRSYFRILGCLAIWKEDFIKNYMDYLPKIGINKHHVHGHYLQYDKKKSKVHDLEMFKVRIATIEF